MSTGEDKLADRGKEKQGKGEYDHERAAGAGHAPHIRAWPRHAERMKDTDANKDRCDPGKCRRPACARLDERQQDEEDGHVLSEIAVRSNARHEFLVAAIADASLIFRRRDETKTDNTVCSNPRAAAAVAVTIG